MKYLSLLGSTGSIGTQTLDIVSKNDDLRVAALAAGSNVELLAKQVRQFKPQLVCIGNENKVSDLKALIGDMNVRIAAGMDGLIEAATIPQAQTVVTAVVGMMGIRPTVAAIRAGKDIALANKETLVTAGHIIMKMAKEHHVQILPVDSEHSAIFQSLNGEDSEKIKSILLTASGGPFRGRTKEQMAEVTLEDALKHPNWAMGRKITIDSATMVNKGLEVMEAKWLFGVGLDQIQVVVHPQSVVHSAVEFVDGAVIAQLGTPDMRLPIQYALYYPKRRFLDTKRLDLFEIGSLTFEKPDTGNFRGLALAYEAMERGGNVPTAFNAANELAVAKFLDRKIKFLEISQIIEYAMNEISYVGNPSLDEIFETENSVYQMIESRW